jgi:response regulator RpfG family c-di-GMP phosphodiesterase
MSLLKAARKKTMREYYLKAPAKGRTTAFICYQYYDRTRKETVSVPYASFNLATNPESPEINITEKGAAANYSVSVEDLVEVKQWLKRNGTYGRPKVPSRVLARVRAEVEEKVRAELKAPAQPSVLKAAKAPAVEDLNTKMKAMLAVVVAVRDELKSLGKGKTAELDEAAATAWRMSSFAFSALLEAAAAHNIGRPRAWQSGEWAGEAIALGFTTLEQVEAARKAIENSKRKSQGKHR